MGLKESGLRGSIHNVSTGIGAAITIDTLEAENVDVDSATIRGEITELTNFGEDAEVFFEWGEITQGLPNTTDIQLQDTVGVFTEDLTNLSEDTTHEFQAFGSVRDVSDDGVVLTFETGAAIADILVDNFEQSDEVDGATEPFGPYDAGEDLSTYYSGDLEEFEIVESSDLGDGQRILVGTGDSNDRIISKPGDGLPNYFDNGQTASCLLNILTDSGSSSDISSRFLFAVEDLDNFIFVGLNGFNDQFEIVEVIDGSTEVIDTSTFTFSDEDVFDCEVQRETEQISVEIFNFDTENGERDGTQTNLTFDNPPLTDFSGIGFEHSGPSDTVGEETRRADNYRLVD